MPRSNHPKGRKAGVSPTDEGDVGRLLSGWRRTETRRGKTWSVQPVPSAAATKVYLCPGCNLEIAPGRAHVVVWRADGVLGDAADLEARRHWHSHCWNLA
jgi:hypothetical protein